MKLCHQALTREFNARNTLEILLLNFLRLTKLRIRIHWKNGEVVEFLPLGSLAVNNSLGGRSTTVRREVYFRLNGDRKMVKRLSFDERRRKEIRTWPQTINAMGPKFKCRKFYAVARLVFLDRRAFHIHHCARVELLERTL